MMLHVSMLYFIPCYYSEYYVTPIREKKMKSQNV